MKEGKFIFEAEAGSFQFEGQRRVDEIRFFRDEEQLEASTLTRMPAALRDWLRIAHCVYVADRTLTRSKPDWPRHLILVIPVRLPQLWRQMTPSLVQVLGFLTNDKWTLQFAPIVRSELPILEQGRLDLDVFDPRAEVALLSAGLDSFAGAVNRLELDPAKRLLLVSAATGSLVQCRQNEQVAYLRERFPGRIDHVSVQHGFIFDGEKLKGESSQRGRGFWHLSLGCIVAILSGASKLHVYENGIGALNLPLTVQRGAQASRPINPVTLRMMSELCSKLLGLAQRLRHGRPLIFNGIENPFEHSTKSRMCVALKPHAAMVPRTHSCDEPPRLTGKDHCGVCSSCLLRRLSLFEARIPDPADQYVHDVFALRSISPADAIPFELMAAQISEFEGLGRRPWKEWTRRFAILPRIVACLRRGRTAAPIQSVTQLYLRYTREWRSFEAACKFRVI